MADMKKVLVHWDGLSGLPGLSVFYTGPSSTGFLAGLRTFFGSWAAQCPSPLTWSFDNTGDIIDDVTGTLTGVWSDTAAAPVTCSGPTAYANGVGAFCRWGTSGIVSGRKVTGKTFMVPLSAPAYDSSGNITSAALAIMQPAAAALAGLGVFRTWHRPPVGTHAGGASFLIAQGTVPDKVAWLQTRKT